MVSGNAQNAVIDRADEIDPLACRALFCAVIEEQWNVVFFRKTSDTPAHVAAAHNWFGTSEFFYCCALAGVDGVAVLEEFRRKFRAEGPGEATRRRFFGVRGRTERKKVERQPCAA